MQLVKIRQMGKGERVDARDSGVRLSLCRAAEGGDEATLGWENTV